jgi:uracil-DNA glycosylase
MQRGKQYWIKQLGTDWTLTLKDTLRDPYMDKLMNYIQREYINYNVFPLKYENLFKAFRLCPWNKVKVVIIGEEPNGITGNSELAFGDSFIHSYQNSSVKAIQKCIMHEYLDEYDLNYDLDFDYTLETWAKQGILLLNQSITRNTEKNESHKRPWNKFIIAVLEALNQYKPGTIILLWGEEVKRFLPLVEKYHHVYTWEHPYTAVREHRDWKCPNFYQTDKMIEYLYGKEEKIQW